ncbi:putative glycoside hydrolase [Microlunatus phosphovorus NM-1]|uniref:beta-fructofuranosidase n=1 Tax=Microlunatus phosphovorus (strain ATCC 700054 / DSM 10555 / JCM 9379 / NBRC 101784 / NCIMB 13414 / VKM Ac-1990 / NM-1) TaxID=1032480 RepID=F5XKY9_MICPN|nr:glycoside hydrolase family 32 protein [Microlunatus phosphovorus]BAK33677.1 putative glycoside hydrolase [Microlunatus phosphovorus NM-1]
MSHTDPSFPGLHGRPDQGWVNDPNGLAVIDGRYHVFFQYNPNAPVHAGICWGHVSSTDLVRWHQEPIALVPRAGGPDERGCFSGCLVDENGTPTAVYTAITHTDYTGVALATSDRAAVSWVQEDAVLADSDQPRGIGIRDPYLFTFGGHRYAVQGGGLAGEKPRVYLYGCDDLREWSFLGELLTGDDPIAAAYGDSNVWECPNLFELDGSWLLLVSPLSIEPDGHGHGEVFALIGELEPDGDGLRFRPSSAGPVDIGPSFYAPQVLKDGERRLLWGWTKDLGRPVEAITAAGWTGALTFPRELRLVDGVLLSEPAAELVALRQERLAPVDGVVTARAFEVEGSTAAVRLALEHDTITETVLDHQREQSSDIRILVDGSIVEVFVDGEPPQTLRAYPGSRSQWRIEGGAELRIWLLGLPGPANRIHD